MFQRVSISRINGAARALDLARVLLLHGDLAARLALRTILQAGGYFVDIAATPSEAVAKLDEMKYDLVLTDSHIGAGETGRNVLAYARVKAYRPATALVTSSDSRLYQLSIRGKDQISICADDVPNLLAKVAELIGARAIRRYRPVRQAV